MLPFVFGILYQIYRYIQKSGLGNYYISLIALFVILDPGSFSQLSLVTFDLPQIFFFFWCINSILKMGECLFQLLLPVYVFQA